MGPFLQDYGITTGMHSILRHNSQKILIQNFAHKTVPGGTGMGVGGCPTPTERIIIILCFNND